MKTIKIVWLIKQIRDLNYRHHIYVILFWNIKKKQLNLQNLNYPSFKIILYLIFDGNEHILTGAQTDK